MTIKTIKHLIETQIGISQTNLRLYCGGKLLHDRIYDVDPAKKALINFKNFYEDDEYEYATLSDLGIQRESVILQSLRRREMCVVLVGKGWEWGWGGEGEDNEQEKEGEEEEEEGSESEEEEQEEQSGSEDEGINNDEEEDDGTEYMRFPIAARSDEYENINLDNNNNIVSTPKYPWEQERKNFYKRNAGKEDDQYQLQQLNNNPNELLPYQSSSASLMNQTNIQSAFVMGGNYAGAGVSMLTGDSASADRQRLIERQRIARAVTEDRKVLENIRKQREIQKLRLIKEQGIRYMVKSRSGQSNEGKGKGKDKNKRKNEKQKRNSKSKSSKDQSQTSVQLHKRKKQSNKTIQKRLTPAFPISINRYSTIWRLKQRIEKLRGYPSEKMTLMSEGRILEDNIFVLDAVEGMEGEEREMWWNEKIKNNQIGIAEGTLERVLIMDLVRWREKRIIVSDGKDTIVQLPFKEGGQKISREKNKKKKKEAEYSRRGKTDQKEMVAVKHQVLIQTVQVGVKLDKDN
ncbi:MAG: hypothetical protein EZS28_018542 [Streblomastix strix]|uniref:Ubiquitin-like domain-containing protein n=1 Tax=Streblomastix strix TaxID=222440 RepID=A0A5J4VTG3_9EUKA|nr:MAG: hypothetical protein EZS28_018542 [Streblomastix strix]